MKSNQKLSLLFWLFKAKATKDGRAPLYVRATVEGKDIEISLNRKVNPEFWDAENKKDCEPGAESKKTNAKIDQIKVDLERHFIVLQSQYEDVTPLMLKNVYNGLEPERSKNGAKQSSKKSIKLVEVADLFIAEFERMVEKAIRSKETLKQWRGTRTKLQEFIQYRYGTADVELNLIGLDFANEYHTYLLLERDVILGKPAAKKQLMNTKQIIGYAETKKWIDKNPIEKFTCKAKEKEVLPLDFMDVINIYQKPILIERLEEVRDAFIFQCFTGFAFQDIYNLKTDNIVQIGEKGEKWLVKKRGKTEVTEMVPILPIVDSIIKKYKDHKDCKRRNKLIPVNSNQKYNAYLKEVADICNVKRNLTTHLARHTFADIMLNICDIPLEDVSKMLGHSSIRTTMRYCRVRTLRISRNMKNAKNILFNKNGKFKTVAA